MLTDAFDGAHLLDLPRPVVDNPAAPLTRIEPALSPADAMSAVREALAVGDIYLSDVARPQLRLDQTEALTLFEDERVSEATLAPRLLLLNLTDKGEETLAACSGVCESRRVAPSGAIAERSGHRVVASVGVPTYETARIAEIKRSDGWSPIRRFFDVRSFGVNAWTGNEAETTVIPDHDEEPTGHEELYLVIEGHATFNVEGEEIDAPTGTIVFVRDPTAQRGPASPQ